LKLKRAIILTGAMAVAFAIPSSAFPAPTPMEGDRTELQDVNELKKSAPRVFIDGDHLDMNFIKDEIQFVNYVRDRKEADVHVLITQQGTGSGGNEYTMSFIGLGPYEDMKNDLKYYSNKIDTRDDSRRGLVQMLKLGLTPFVARTPMAAALNLNMSGKVRATAVEDKWNFWVFSLSGRGRLNGEMSRKSNSLFGNASVNRITPESKLRMGVSGNIDESRYDYVDYKSTSRSTSRAFDGLYVKSLSEHWSLGAIVNLSYSTYSNIAFGISVYPAVEYNFFPYSESTRHQFRLLYRIGLNVDRYLERTVFSKMEDKTASQALSATFEVTEPWGNIELSLEGSNYFFKGHDWKYYRFRISGNVSVRIIKGLSLTVDGRYNGIHDQLALRAGDASLEELLLRRTELASSYSYQMNVGLSFSFGSVYSNVVNPRFGGGFGGSGGGWYF
jgi:hypothetical protein